ncbi:MAG TPA: DisA protein, partial [Desulfobacterales bacterium]|nr:DisA protein [Desulfobacterales bacterium]
IYTEKILLDKITESGTAFVNLVLNPASLRLENNNKIQIEYLISKKSML